MPEEMELYLSDHGWDPTPENIKRAASWVIEDITRKDNGNWRNLPEAQGGWSSQKKRRVVAQIRAWLPSVK